MANNQASTNGLKVGDTVRSAYSGNVVGVVTNIVNARHVWVKGDRGTIVVEEYEVDAIPPTPEQAWSVVPMIALTQIKALGPRSVIFEFDRRIIRRACYVALGGAPYHIKITDEVKERVTGIVENVARALGIRVA